MRSLDDVVFLRLPPRSCFAGGPPASMRAELERLRSLETVTLQRLHHVLGACDLEMIQKAVTEPLLASGAPSATKRRKRR